MYKKWKKITHNLRRDRRQNTTNKNKALLTFAREARDTN